MADEGDRNAARLGPGRRWTMRRDRHSRRPRRLPPRAHPFDYVPERPRIVVRVEEPLPVAMIRNGISRQCLQLQFERREQAVTDRSGVDGDGRRDAGPHATRQAAAEDHGGGRAGRGDKWGHGRETPDVEWHSEIIANQPGSARLLTGTARLAYPFGVRARRGHLSRVAEGPGPKKPQQPGAFAKVLIPAR